MRKILFMIFMSALSLSLYAQKTVSLEEICDAVINKGKKYVVIEDYKGMVFTQGMAEFAMATGSDKRLGEIVAIIATTTYDSLEALYR